MSFPERIVAILAAATRPMSGEEVADILYADRADGGPISARNVVAVTISHMRKRGDKRVIGIKGKGGGLWLASRPLPERRRDPRVETMKQMRLAGFGHREIGERFGLAPKTCRWIAWRHGVTAPKMMREGVGA